MNRDNGYLVLDSVLKEQGIDTSSINSILRSSNILRFGDPSSDNFSFFYNNCRYFYKPHNPYDGDVYFELIAGEILTDLDMNHVEYDLAKVKNANSFGVISKDFKIEGATYITGEQLLNSNYSDYVGRHNNLEDIWASLSNRYKDNPNKDDIVFYLMDKFVDLYIFDIFICQSDRNPNNYQIMEYNGNIDLAPIYDNEEYGRNIPNAIKVNSLGYSNLTDNLGEFLEVSDIRYSERIKSRLWIIEEANIRELFKRIESKTNYPIPNDLKQKYLDFFEIIRLKIKKTLRKDDARRR